MHEISYRNFKRGEFKHKGAEDLFKKTTNKEAHGEPNGDKVNDEQLSSKAAAEAGEVVVPPAEGERDKVITEVT